MSRLRTFTQINVNVKEKLYKEDLNSLLVREHYKLELFFSNRNLCCVKSNIAGIGSLGSFQSKPPPLGKKMVKMKGS